MEYSIFQDFQYFGCLYIFLEYSIFQITQVFSCFKIFWNIPYSKKFKIFYVASFFGIWHNLYSPQKTQFWMENQFFDNSCYIPYSKNFNISLVEGFFLEYSWNIPYSKYFNISLLKVYFGIFHFWDFHIPWNIPWNIPLNIPLSKISLFYGGVKFNQDINR